MLTFWILVLLLRPYLKPCGIPQGDPFSMMLMSYLMMPWAVKMTKEGAKPRILADDVMVMVEGDEEKELQWSDW